MVRAILFLLLFLAPALRAQDDAAAEHQEALEEAKERLTGLKDDESEEGKRWSRAVGFRIQLLEEMQRTLKERDALPKLDELDRRHKELEQQLAAAKTSPADISFNLQEADDVTPFTNAFNEARSELTEKANAVKELEDKRKRATDERQTLPARRAEAQRRESELKKDDDLGKYRVSDARLEQHVSDERLAFTREALKVWDRMLAVAKTEVELARTKVDRAKTRLDAAEEQAKELRASAAERERREAKRKAEQAKREKDPVFRFVKELEAETARRASEITQLKSRVETLKQRTRKERESIQRLGQVFGRIQRRSRFQDQGSTEILTGLLDRARRELTLGAKTVRDVDKSIAKNQGELVGVLDRLSSTQLPPDEVDEVKAVEGAIPAERRPELYEAFAKATEGADGLFEALRAQEKALEVIDSTYGELTVIYEERRKELRRIEELLVRVILWKRSDVPISGATFTGAIGDVRKVLHTPMGKLAPEAADPLRLAACGAGFVLAFVLARRLARLHPGVSGPVRGVAIGVVWTVLPPVVFMGAAHLIVPGYVALVLTLAAWLWLARRGVTALFSPGGVGVTHLRIPAEVAAQLHRSGRIAILATLFLLLPAELLRAEPFGLRALPRLVSTVWLIATLYSVGLLLRSGGALCQRSTQPGGLARRSWALFGPLARISLVVLLVMDVTGYRVGATFLFERLVRTLSAVVILTALYHALVMTVGRIATVVQRKVVRVKGNEAATDASDAVSEQLTRAVAGILVAAAVGMLLYSWDAYGMLRSVLANVKLVEVVGKTDTTWVTLWEVMRAIVWIAGAHFIVGNLAALSESAALPQADSGRRYVFIALSRYVILLVAYGAAMTVLQIPWERVAWLLTALSVGIGFGLQEIVANFVSGVILLIERPVRVGDTITVGDTPGRVKRISIRATVVEAWDRKSIVIPNKSLITQNVTNWTHEDLVMRRELDFTVAYGTDLGEAIRIVDELVTGHPRVLKKPERMIRVQGFTDAGIHVIIFYFCQMPDAYSTSSELYESVYREFREHGIEFPRPRRDLRVRDGDQNAGTASTGQGD